MPPGTTASVFLEAPVTPNDSPLGRLPSPVTIRQHMGRLYKELALLRRLLRISQQARHDAGRGQPSHREVAHA